MQQTLCALVFSPLQRYMYFTDAGTYDVAPLSLQWANEVALYCLKTRPDTPIFLIANKTETVATRVQAVSREQVSSIETRA